MFVVWVLAVCVVLHPSSHLPTQVYREGTKRKPSSTTSQKSKPQNGTKISSHKAN